jgi:hypothetical protein
VASGHSGTTTSLATTPAAPVPGTTRRTAHREQRAKRIAHAHHQASVGERRPGNPATSQRGSLLTHSDATTSPTSRHHAHPSIDTLKDRTMSQRLACPLASRRRRRVAQPRPERPRAQAVRHPARPGRTGPAGGRERARVGRGVVDPGPDRHRDRAPDRGPPPPGLSVGAAAPPAGLECAAAGASRRRA